MYTLYVFLRLFFEFRLELHKIRTFQILFSNILCTSRSEQQCNIFQKWFHFGPKTSYSYSTIRPKWMCWVLAHKISRAKYKRTQTLNHLKFQCPTCVSKNNQRHCLTTNENSLLKSIDDKLFKYSHVIIIVIVLSMWCNKFMWLIQLKSLCKE